MHAPRPSRCGVSLLASVGGLLPRREAMSSSAMAAALTRRQMKRMRRSINSSAVAPFMFLPFLVILVGGDVACSDVGNPTGSSRAAAG